jgi:hypothetical protein
MSLLPVGIGSEEGGYQIERSLRFNSADSAYLNRTPASAGNRKTYTHSFWMKRSKLGGSVFQMIHSTGNAGSDRDVLYFPNNNSEQLAYYTTVTIADDIFRTTQVFRDVSSWYHIVLAVDTTQATATNRFKLYVNGQEVTAFSLDNRSGIGQNTDLNTNNTIVHNIGRDVVNAGLYYDGYLTEIHFIDGQALTPTSFGEFNSDTGVWQPIEYTGTYGTNGFYLPFSDNASTTTLGDDFSGNNNDWTLNNFSVTAGAGNDSLVDSPTRYGTDTGAGGEVRGNYCTLNPLDKGTSGSVSNGNLNWLYATAAWNGIRSTFSVPKTGKWYWEATILGTACDIGIYTSVANLNSSGYNDAYCYSYGSGNAAIRYGGVDQTIVATYTTNDVIAYSVNEGEVKVYKNNSLIGTWSQNLSAYGGDYFAGAFCNSNSNGIVMNFGQRPFASTAPAGFKALVTTNLP